MMLIIPHITPINTSGDMHIQVTNHQYEPYLTQSINMEYLA